MTGLPIYEELNIIKTYRAFKRYAQSFRAEIVNRKDPICQLSASKSSDLLNQAIGFSYQINVKVLFEKYKSNEIEFCPV